MGTNLAGSNVTETFAVSGFDSNTPYINIGGNNAAAVLTLTTTAAGVVVTEGSNAIQQTTQFIALQVLGSGKVVFQGDDTYTGGTFINGAFVSIGSAGALGAAGVSFINAAMLEADFTGTFRPGLTVNAGAIATVGATSGNTLTLTGQLSVLAGMPATLQLGSATDTGTIDLALAGNPTIASTTALNIGGGTVVLTNAAAGNLIFDMASVALSASATLDLDGESVEATDLSGASTSTVTDEGSGASTLTLFNDADTTFAGAIEDGSVETEIISLDVLGSGTLTLSGASTYSGTTTIHSGMTLALQSNNALGSIAGGTTVNGGATLKITGDGLSFGEAVTLSGTGVDGGGALVDDDTGGTNGAFWSGSITLAGDARIDSEDTAGGFEIDRNISGAGENLTLGGTGQEFFFGGIQTGSGTLTKDGTGTIQLEGTDTYTGVTTVNAGSLQLVSGSTIADNGAVVVNGPGDLFLLGNETVGSIAGSGTITLQGTTLTTGGDGTSTAFSGVIQSLGTGNLTKIGAGTQTLSGADTYSGVTTVSAGTLDVQNAAALGTTDGGTTVSSGATLEIEGDNLTIGEPLTLSGMGVGNGGALRNHDTGSSGNDLNGPITLTGATRINDDGGISGSQFEIDGTIGGTNQDLTLGGVGIQFIAGAIQTGSGMLTKDGTGTVHLIAADAYSGATTVSAGTLDIQDANALGATTAGTTVKSGATLKITGDNINMGEPLTLSGMGVGNGGALRDNDTGTNNNDLSGTITLAAATRINEDNAAGRGLEIDGTIGGSNQALTLGGAGDEFIFGAIQTGTGTLTKDGSGEAFLSGTNTYTGTTTVAAGILDLQGGSAIADTGAVVVNAPGDLFLIASETVGSIAGNGKISIQGDSLTTGGNGTSTTFSGVIESIGAGNLTKIGAGTLTLSGADTYTGATTVSAGTLQIGNGGATGSIGGAVDDESALVFNRGNAATLAIAVSGAGSLRQSGAGTMILAGAETVSGGVTIDAGRTLALAGGGSLQGKVTGSGTLSLTGGTTTVASGTVMTVGTLSLSGNATVMSLAGPLSFAGTLKAATGATLALASGSLVLNGGATFANAIVTGSQRLYLKGSSTAIAGLTIGGTAVLEATKTVRQAGSTVVVGDGTTRAAILLIDSGAIYAITDNSAIARGAATGSRVLNQGLFAKTGGVGNSTVAASFIDAGTVAVAGGGTLTFTGPSNAFAGSIGGQGSVVFGGGTTTIKTGTTVRVGTFAIGGAGTVVTLAETLAYAGSFSVGTGARLAIATGDTLSLSGSSLLSTALSGGGTLAISGGQATLSGGAALTTAAVTLSGSGGALTVGTNLSYAGTFTAGAGTTLSLTGGNLQLSGGATLTGAALNGSRRLFAGGTTAITSGLTIGGTTVLVGTKTVTQAGGTVQVGDASGGAAVLFAAAGATYSITDDSSIARGTAGSYILDQGTIQKTGGMGTSTIAPNIVNNTSATGTVAVTSGTLDLGGTLSGALALKVGAGDTLILEKSATTATAASYAGAGATLQLNDAQDYHGTIAGFAGGEGLDLRSIGFGAGITTTIAYSGNTTAGTLTVSDGSRTASLAMLGSYTRQNFALATDGHGGTAVTFA